MDELQRHDRHEGGEEGRGQAQQLAPAASLHHGDEPAHRRSPHHSVVGAGGDHRTEQGARPGHPPPGPPTHSGEDEGREQGPQAGGEQVGEVHAALDRDDGRGEVQRAGQGRDPSPVGDLPGEDVRAQDREPRRHDQGELGPADELPEEDHERPAQRVLGEEHSISVPAEPRLVERRVAAVRAGQLAVPEQVGLPQVDGFVAVPGQVGARRPAW